ncbi:MAG: hypothetical protein EGR71_05980 [Clostridiales bacterium]|nr:hypothetical protein [Clostridiales bacterium]
MGELIEKNNYVENSISTLRKQEEQIYSVIDENYGTLTSLLTFENIDYISEVLSDLTANIAVKKLYDKQYFEPRYGKFKNFFTRNIYLNPIKKEKMKIQRELTYDGVRMTTEIATKAGSRALAKMKFEKEKYTTYKEIYELLYMYANECSNINNNIALKIELRKILGCFDLKENNKTKLLMDVKNDNIKQLDLLKGNFINNASDEVVMNISYLLYVLANTKYDNEEEIEHSLLNYYEYLGFHSANIKEILVENENTYKTVERDQHRMIAISRQMIGQLFIDIPEFNIKKILERGNEIAKFDPYALRRRKIQGGLLEGANAVKKVTIQQITKKYPELSMLAASESLAQFNLTDNMKENAEKKLIEWSGGERKICENIINNSKQITEEAQNLFL